MKIVFVINNLSFLISHREEILLEVLRSGYQVTLITGRPENVETEALAYEKIKNLKLIHKKTLFSGSSKNLFLEFIGFLQVSFFILTSRPEIVHCISPKAVLYGGIAALMSRTKCVVVSISGMGLAYTSPEKKKLFDTLLLAIYEQALKLVLSNRRLKMIVQNRDDEEFFINRNFIQKEKVILVPGSGVRIQNYLDVCHKKKEPLILLPSRLIVQKGVYEFVDAARILKKKFPQWRFCVAGSFAYLGENAVKEQEIYGWVEEGIIEYLGYISDMVPIYRATSIVCLPSYYREGLPKCLLEAAAAKCAVVTYDSIGCRDAILPGHTGELVPPKNINALVKTLSKIISDEPLRKYYGDNGHDLAVDRFSVKTVVDTHMKIYRL